MLVNKIKCAISLIVLLLIMSCSEDPQIDNYNKKEWQQYSMGCKEGRAQIAKLILSNKKQWLGLDDDVIIHLLGNPERSYYYERNMRSFAYYLMPGKQCDSSLNTFGERLIVEFNSTGYSKRIYLENDH